MSNRQHIFLAFLLTLAAACGRKEESSSSSSSVAARTDLLGSVKNTTGSQREMARWVVAFIERDTGIAKVGEIDAIGNYALSQVAGSSEQTIVLLDSQFRLSAVLAQQGSTSGVVHQFFTLAGTQVPTFVHAGPTIGFADFAGVTFSTDIAADIDLDGIPDGMDASALRFGYGLASIDTDGDRVFNELDVDIDGDGIVNWVDADDDGDGLPDLFDFDANEDGTRDSLQLLGDHYFSEGIDYLATQVVQEVQVDGSMINTLVVTAKLNGSIVPSAVNVRGPVSLFADSSAVVLDAATGEATLTPWDGTLANDGANEDAGAGDLVYARRIQLDPERSPKANQMIFLQLVEQVGLNTVLTEFPYTFPDLTTGAIAGAFDEATREVTLQGTPFDGIADYIWTVHIFDEDGIKVFSSEPVSGGEATYIVPGGVLETGVSYSAAIVASSLDRVPGYPAWIVRSAPFNLQ